MATAKPVSALRVFPRSCVRVGLPPLPSSNTHRQVSPSQHMNCRQERARGEGGRRDPSLPSRERRGTLSNQRRKAVAPIFACCHEPADAHVRRRSNAVPSSLHLRCHRSRLESSGRAGGSTRWCSPNFSGRHPEAAVWTLPRACCPSAAESSGSRLTFRLRRGRLEHWWHEHSRPWPVSDEQWRLNTGSPLSSRRLKKQILGDSSMSLEASNTAGHITLRDELGTPRSARVVQQAEHENFNMVSIKGVHEARPFQIELRHGGADPEDLRQQGAHRAHQVPRQPHARSRLAASFRSGRPAGMHHHRAWRAPASRTT